MSTECYKFGPFEIEPKEVFYNTALSYAMVNRRPVVSGHVLVCPRREVKRFVDLTVDETIDLWLTAQRILARAHIHILPRTDGDFDRHDDIYDAIDVKEKELKGRLDLDKESKDKSLEDMCKEQTDGS
ncbi:hypothetical protein DITRI_Ditri12bG0116400 [Diplodiscus trichospermus]